MRWTTVFAGALAVVIGGLIGRVFMGEEPVVTAMPTEIAESELVTNTIASRPILVRPSAPAAAFPQTTSPAAFPTARANATAAPRSPCSNPDALGISRVVEIDSAGGPGFGFEHFKAYDFLREREVVLTFDDGPWPRNTPAVLKALADQCTKAIFFPIGKHATWHPEILRQVDSAGHTVGSHTWSHANLSRLTIDQAKEEFEKGVSAVRAALGAPGASFFRFPALRHPAEMVTYLGTRNIGIFSTDMDSFDFKIRKPEQVVVSVITKLKKRGKGIVLLHDFQHSTALALPALLAQLKADGYKIVQVKARDPVKTLPEYDEAIIKEFGGNSIGARPTTSIVRTIAE
jgi:peptidoglycan/xylan/chitin deacetylase (PgdA/CDA1 family)